MQALGYLPAWLDTDDPAPAREQFDRHYGRYGGWQPLPGWKLLANNTMLYPGDPPYRPRAMTKLRDELIVYYQSSWVAIIQKDRSFEMCRMD
jgi:hypothetical protein